MGCRKKKAASGVVPCAASDKTTGAKNHTPVSARTKHTKQGRILRVLADGASLNRFEAERIGDHTLPSTISAIQSQHGLTISRVSERVPNNYGTATTCARYFLTRANMRKALRILRTPRRQVRK